jgi:hypothetical protein
MYEDYEDYFKTAHAQADARAGAWAEPAAKGLAAVSHRCLEYLVKSRATVRDVRPQLHALAARY